MTVKELIDKLKEFPENIEIRFDGNFYIQGWRDTCEISKQIAGDEEFIVIEVLEEFRVMENK